jgi:hypothetical protein
MTLAAVRRQTPCHSILQDPRAEIRKCRAGPFDAGRSVAEGLHRLIGRSGRLLIQVRREGFCRSRGFRPGHIAGKTGW